MRRNNEKRRTCHNNHMENLSGEHISLSCRGVQIREAILEEFKDLKQYIKKITERAVVSVMNIKVFSDGYVLDSPLTDLSRT